MVTRRKPRVAIIHSHSSKRSRTGEDLSVFLAVCLQLGGKRTLSRTLVILGYVHDIRSFFGCMCSGMATAFLNEVECERDLCTFSSLESCMFDVERGYQQDLTLG